MTRRIRTFILVGCLLLVAFAASSLLLADNAEPAVVAPDPTTNAKRVVVEPALEWQQAIETKIYCNVSTPFTHQISSHAQAELSKILPNGTIVEAGDLVAQQNGFYLARDLEVLEIDIKLAQAQFDQANVELGRIKSLSKDGLVSKSQLNQLELQTENHRLTKLRLQQQLLAARHRLKNLAHYAPFDAQVVQVTAQPGQQLASGQEILRLSPIEKKQFECLLPHERYQKISDLENLRFKLDGQELALRQIGQMLDKDTQNLTLYFDYLALGDKSLLVGQRFQLTMLERTDRVTKVPADAVRLEGNTYQVWTVGKEHKAAKLPVKVLDTLNAHFVIQSELKPGDSVVVQGYQGLQPNQDVQPVTKAKL